jgi:hypothetical protein
MDRRKFLSTLIGGVASTAAVRTFPFRVFSFPKEAKIAEKAMACEWPAMFGPPKGVALYGSAIGGQPRFLRMISVEEARSLGFTIPSFGNLERFPYPGRLWTP